MESKIRWAFGLSLLNIFCIIGFSAWTYHHIQTHDHIDGQTLEALLEEVAYNNPKFFVNLLNTSANTEQNSQQEKLENFIFENKQKILQQGFCIKNSESIQKSLVVFMDMTCPHCLTFLKNVQTSLPQLNCSVYLIPISVLGEKAIKEALLIMAASLQNPEKALQLALTYDSTDDAKNNRITAASKLGFDMVKLSQDINSEIVKNMVITQTKFSEEANLPGIPGIFLITEENAYFLPPVEAQDLKNLVDNPIQNMHLEDDPED